MLPAWVREGAKDVHSIEATKVFLKMGEGGE